MLEVSQPEVFHGPVQALKGVDIKADKGRVTCVLGSNGAGKSSLLQSIAGLVHPAKGSILIEGMPIEKKRAFEIRRLGITLVPEGRGIFPQLTVLENFRMGAYAQRRGESVECDFQRVFELFPILGKYRSRHAATLSGGEQQMLAVACGTLGHPRLMLLDEPSLGLAPLLVKEVFEIVRNVCSVGTTILLVEQNANIALSIAGFGYVLENGLVSISGPSQRLMKNERVKKAYLGM